MKIINLLVATNLLLYSLPSHAYLDPASGSALIASSGSIIFILVILCTKITQYIFGFVVTHKSNINIFNHWDLVIHIEYDGYYSTFENFININKNKKILIISSKNIEHILSKKNLKNNNIKICIADTLFKQSSIISLIKCDYFATSTPGIGTRYFKRNKKIKNTIYIAHAASDVHSYNLMAFDHFDIIFCPNQIIKNNIQLILKKRANRLIPKIYVVSLQYLLYIQNNTDYKNSDCQNKFLLIAPSWGKKSLLGIINDELLNGIVILAKKMSLKVVFRPHPQSISTQDSVYKYIDLFFKKSDVDYSIDFNDMPYKSLANSKILISDFSSIIYDYHFINEEPVSICYFNEDENIDPLKESIFLENKSLEYLKYSECVIFSKDYENFLTSINNFNPSPIYKKINVDKLFMHQNCDYLLDINNLKCTNSY